MSVKQLAMSVGDLSEEQLRELAMYLEGFPPSDPEEEDPDPEQYWFSLAETVRKRTNDQFHHYTTLVRVAPNNYIKSEFITIALS